MTEKSEKGQNTNKISVALIIGIPVIGILLTTAYYFYLVNQGVQLGSHNQGVLISPPKELASQTLSSNDAPYQWLTPEKKWSFMVVAGADCDKSCVDKLYLARQIRSAMGKHQRRLQYVYLNLGGQLTEQTKTFLKEEHPQIIVVDVDGDAVTQWFQSEAPALDILNAANFYVVDPASWVMMYYTDEHTYKEVIKDMKFLIKNS